MENRANASANHQLNLLQYMEQVINNSLDIIQLFTAVRDEQDKIVDFVWLFNNTKAVAQNGDVIGKSLLQQNPGVISSGIFEKMVWTTETGESSQEEVHYRYEQFNGWFYQALAKSGDGVVMTTRDISEQKKTEEQILHLKEEIAKTAIDKYHSIFNSIDEGFCIYELVYDLYDKPADLRWIEVNPAYETHTGLKDVVGKLHSELSLQTEDFWFDIYNKVVKTGEAVHFEHWHEPTKRWYNTFTSRIGARNTRQVAVLFSDITERKQQEERQAFLLKLGDTLRAETSVEAVGNRAVQMIAEQLKADRVYLVTLTPGDNNIIITHQTKREDMPPLKNSYRGSDFPSAIKEIFERTLVYNDIRTDTRLAELDRLSFAGLGAVAFMSAPIRRGKESMIGAAGALSTESRVWLPAEIALFEDAVERSWAAIERTKAEEALREREAQLEQSLKLRDDFISVASHELKTPVTSILAFAEVVEARLEKAGNKEDAGIIKQLNAQVDRLTSLINSLLDTTRIAEGGLQMNVEPTDISHLINERLEEIRRTTTHHFYFEKKSISLVMADGERIGQVITNLLANAIKYSPNSSSIYITAEQQNENILVAVRDQGHGIAGEEQEKIFDRFYRVTDDKMGTYPGMGLGLYISAQIIQRHKGRIWVESEPGKGSTFYFTLPY